MRSGQALAGSHYIHIWAQYSTFSASYQFSALNTGSYFVNAGPWWLIAIPSIERRNPGLMDLTLIQHFFEPAWVGKSLRRGQ
jgi:hypothetical protein